MPYNTNKKVPELCINSIYVFKRQKHNVIQSGGVSFYSSIKRET